MEEQNCGNSRAAGFLEELKVIFLLSLPLLYDFVLTSYRLFGIVSNESAYGGSWEPIRSHFTIRKELKRSTITQSRLHLINRKNRTNAACVRSRSQRPAISALTCTFTADRGLSNVKSAREASASRRISRIISSYTRVSGCNLQLAV